MSLIETTYHRFRRWRFFRKELRLCRAMQKAHDRQYEAIVAFQEFCLLHDLDPFEESEFWRGYTPPVLDPAFEEWLRA